MDFVSAIRDFSMRNVTDIEMKTKPEWGGIAFITFFLVTNYHEEHSLLQHATLSKSNR